MLWPPRWVLHLRGGGARRYTCRRTCSMGGQAADLKGTCCVAAGPSEGGTLVTLLPTVLTTACTPETFSGQQAVGPLHTCLTCSWPTTITTWPGEEKFHYLHTRLVVLQHFIPLWWKKETCMRDLCCLDNSLCRRCVCTGLLLSPYTPPSCLPPTTLLTSNMQQEAARMPATAVDTSTASTLQKLWVLGLLGCASYFCADTRHYYKKSRLSTSLSLLSLGMDSVARRFRVAPGDFCASSCLACCAGWWNAHLS